MHEHQPHLGSFISVSLDGLRASEVSVALDVNNATPAYHQEDILTNAALEDANFRWDLGDMSLPTDDPVDPVADGISFKKK